MLLKIFFEKGAFFWNNENAFGVPIIENNHEQIYSDPDLRIVIKKWSEQTFIGIGVFLFCLESCVFLLKFLSYSDYSDIVPNIRSTLFSSRIMWESF